MKLYVNAIAKVYIKDIVYENTLCQIADIELTFPYDYTKDKEPSDLSFGIANMIYKIVRFSHFVVADNYLELLKIINLWLEKIKHET